MVPRPFHIEIETSVLDDLRQRLERTRWAKVLPDDNWDAGTRPAYLRDIVAYWRDAYDWRGQEARLNALPHFKVRIDEADLHFVHVRGEGPKPTALLLLHGWPDSFLRFQRVLEPLASKGFDLVVPSFPGFAFTGPVRYASPAQTMRQAAGWFQRLMTDVLGYRRFAVAGGDGGSVAAQLMALDHPESVIGIHLTDIGWHAWNIDKESATHAERKFLDAAMAGFMKDGGYAMVQKSTPRSLAPGLNDSPAGLASWILDRFHSWTDGDLAKRFDRDELLTNIMLYWVTQTIGSSFQGYNEEARAPSITPADRIGRPAALALFPRDIGGIPPRELAERTLDVRRWTEMPRGGHFAAWEEPELYAADVAAFFASLEADSGSEEASRARPPVRNPRSRLDAR